MTFEITFLISFFFQVVVLSFYFPNRIIRRSNAFIEEFPPNSYPRLYGWPVEKWRSTIRTYQLLSRMIFGIGVVLLLGFVFLGLPSSLLAQLVTWFGFTAIQLACNLWRMNMSVNRLKAIELEEPPVRSAELVPRHLTDYVSPFHWCIAVASILLMLVAATLLAMKAALILPIVIPLIPLFMNGVFLRNGLKIVRGEIRVPQIARALNKNAVIKQAVRSVPDAMIRVNLMFVAVFFFVVSGAHINYVLALACALVVADSASWFIWELRFRDEELLNMEVFK